MKSLHVGLMALAVTAAYGQPTTGAVYWSTVAPDCSSLNNETPATITNSSGTTIGYSCYVSGAFLWLAAGGVDYNPAKWGTSIRVAAPASAAIGVDYSFYDKNGNNLSLNTGGSQTVSSNDVNFALYANQPSEIDLLGATSDGPNYRTTATGSVYAVFYCPDAGTCSNVLPQLIYSALPTANTYTVHVYNSAGTLVGTGTTPSIPGAPNAQGGTYATLLSQIISTPLPRGTLKVLVDGGTLYSAVEVLQIDGSSATTLQVAYDTAPLASATVPSVPRSNVSRSRVESMPRQVFSPLRN